MNKINCSINVNQGMLAVRERIKIAGTPFHRAWVARIEYAWARKSTAGESDNIVLGKKGVDENSAYKSSGTGNCDGFARHKLSIFLKERIFVFSRRLFWCGREDLNFHALRHRLLRPACLPFHHVRLRKGL